MTERQEENIGNLKKLRAMIKKDMNTVAQVNKVQDKIEGMTTAGKKALSSEIADFKKLRKNVLAREEPKFRDSPASRKAMAPKEGGPKTPTKLPKPKPKRPTQVAAAKPKSSGVTFDTSGTLPGQTIKRMNNGGAVMSGRGGKFKGIF
jgi:hypothetical protein|tara:strand:+ start:931 stop:1374 length:444 start_codon:yes stop_codon:yes gene_type:complete